MVLGGGDRAFNHGQVDIVATGEVLIHRRHRNIGRLGDLADGHCLGIDSEELFGGVDDALARGRLAPGLAW
ncbi:hypothetical protein NN3_13100 [Nocardia neocaledoniensis NBRC 108232]|nr:hypothetical protein NN3_13100 [Nocardia neocaledoniensis NBRC 108232]